MGFDARAFDRAQRRKALKLARDKPGSIRLPSKPKKRKPPTERKKYDRSKTPLTAEQLSEIRKDAARNRQFSNKPGVKARTEADKDQECDDVLAILQILCEKLNR